MADSKTRQMAMLDDWRYEHGKPDARYPEPPAVVEREVTRVIPQRLEPRSRQEMVRRDLTDREWDRVAHPEISRNWRGVPIMRSRKHSATAIYDPTIDRYVGGDQIKVREDYFKDSLRKDAALGLFGPGGSSHSALFSDLLPGNSPYDEGPYTDLVEGGDKSPLHGPSTSDIREYAEESGQLDSPYEAKGGKVSYSGLANLKNEVDLLKFGLPEGYFGSERHIREEKLSQKMGQPLTEEVKISRAIMKKALEAGRKGGYKSRDLMYGNYSEEERLKDSLQMAAEFTGITVGGAAALVALMAGGPF